MTTFWQQLAQIARGQLFASGHLSPGAIAAVAKRGDTPAQSQRSKTCRDPLPWPRLAIPH